MVIIKKIQKIVKKVVSKSMIKSKIVFFVKKFFIIVFKNVKICSKYVVNKMVLVSFIEKCIKCKGYKLYCVKVKNVVLGIFVDVYKVKV